MRNRFVRTTSMLVILAALLAVAAGAAWGYDAERETGQTTSDAEQVDDTSLICLALVSGTAMLAGGVWIGQMRRMLS
ncbi:MAG: hypothetical protein DRI77_02455 [Chloroflexi bacterium]|nr:MAG: hypothetical protein DRI77_02455 [Chloroflexota bacterium]